MLSILVLLTALAAEPQFDVLTLDGRSATGRLVELDAERLAIETADGRKTFELGTLATASRVGAVPPQPAARPAVLVELVDGSRLPLSGYTATGDTARMTLPGGKQVELTARAVRWVRFLAPEAADERLEKQWSELAESQPAGDILVIRKSGALDEVEGTLRGVTAEAVRFEVDQEAVSVKLAKVEGLVYARSAAAEAPEPLGFVTVADGTRVALQNATLGEGSLVVKSPSGFELPIPLESVTRLDFSSGKIVYLSDLEPQAASYSPMIAANDELPAVAEYYHFRRDLGFAGRPLALDGTTFRKGLALASRTSVAYRLPGKFRVFKATVGIDDSVRPLGSVRLSIVGDGKTLWQGEVRGSEPASELEVDMGGVKRLEIVADYGDGLDTSDRLDLCEARVSK